MRESFTVETDDRLQALDITDRVDQSLPAEPTGRSRSGPGTPRRA